MASDDLVEHHKDPFGARKWLEVPVQGPAAEQAWKRFQRHFGNPQWEVDALSFMRWPKRWWFKDDVPVFDSTVVSNEPWLWAFLNRRQMFTERLCRKCERWQRTVILMDGICRQTRSIGVSAEVGIGST